MRKLKDILLYLWQLPQNILGLILTLILDQRGTMYYIYIDEEGKQCNIKYIATPKGKGGAISLGNYIILYNSIKDFCGTKECTANVDTVKHEYGHQIQSKYLGPFYLFVIGLSSLIWTQVYKKVGKDYYWFWTEKWADKLGKVKR